MVKPNDAWKIGHKTATTRDNVLPWMCAGSSLGGYLFGGST